MVLAGVVLATLSGLAAPGAQAVAGGVHFDPNSPAGKEYALPLAQARNEATGGGQADEASGTSAQLFGAGIAGRGPGAGGIPLQRAEKGTPRASQQTQRPRRRKSVEKIRLGAHLSGIGGSYPVTDSAAIVAMIVLLGGGFGLALRALQRVSSD
jgi:hypothetical protein